MCICGHHRAFHRTDAKLIANLRSVGLAPKICCEPGCDCLEYLEVFRAATEEERL